MDHPRGCALPISARDAIREAGKYVPWAAVEAALAAAEDAALEARGQDGMRELRWEDQEARMAADALAQLQQRVVVAADGIQVVGGWLPQNAAPLAPQAGWALSDGRTAIPVTFGLPASPSVVPVSPVRSA